MNQCSYNQNIHGVFMELNKLSLSTVWKDKMPRMFVTLLQGCIVLALLDIKIKPK